MATTSYINGERMIILDFNQIFISNIVMNIKNNDELQEDLVRHMVLSSIRKYKRKFSDEYGEIVIACDDKNYWRKKLFPYYKAHRKKFQEKSTFDWNAIFLSLNKIRDELDEFFPYKVIRIDSAEADDIIATLVMNKSNEVINNNNKILILSGDKDFIQLHRYPNVKQYNPVKDKFVTHSNPDVYLKEHIIRGDIGDGIPNFLSIDESFVNGIRQKSIMAKKLENWLKQEPEEFCEDDDTLKHYHRNKQLIDLTMVPSEIQNDIMNKYREEKNFNSNNLFNYFIKFRLKNLMDSIQDFV